MKLFIRSRRREACAVFLGAAIVLTWRAAAATTIPTYVIGSRTLVAVEPLLQNFEIGYVIAGDKLVADGRPYPKLLVYRHGFELVDATDIASFLHLKVSKKNGVITFMVLHAPDTREPAPPSKPDLDALRSELIQALNAHRSAAGSPPLAVDEIAERAAQFQAEDMARAGAMRHLDAKGRTPMQRYDEYGGRASVYGENVGWYGVDVTGAAALWSALSNLDVEMMAEQPPNDGHRENILSRRFDAVGIGVSIGPSGVYLAEDFVTH